MGFLDKAKAAASDLAAKADTALAGAGLGGGSQTGQDSESYLRDMGVIAYLEGTGRALPAEERERVLSALQTMEQSGVLTSLTLRTTVSGPLPGQPGGMGFTPPPPGAGQTPPSADSSADSVAGDTLPEMSSAVVTPDAEPSTPPPPPPSWS